MKLNYLNFGYVNGKPTALIQVMPLPGANTIDIVNNVHKRVATISKTLPDSLSIDTLMDSAVFIEESMHEVEFTIILTSLIVIFIIFVFFNVTIKFCNSAKLRKMNETTKYCCEATRKQDFWHPSSSLERMAKILFLAKLALRIFGRFAMSAGNFMSEASKVTKSERDGKIKVAKQRKFGAGKVGAWWSIYAGAVVGLLLYPSVQFSTFRLFYTTEAFSALWLVGISYEELVWLAAR